MNTALQEIDVRATLLWRQSRWHCACGRVASRWIAQLYLDDVIVAECAFSLVGPMLRIAQHWHVAVKSNPSALVLVGDGPCENERRDHVAERRAIPRGGRRGTDAGRPPHSID
jgi:hypothetical protein